MSSSIRKPVFDTVRTILKRGLRQREVNAIDTALDGVATGVVTGVNRSIQGTVGARAISSAGIALIKRFEGCARQRRDGLIEAYPDPGTGGDPWTIGWGATGADDRSGAELGARIKAGLVWTRAECDARLERDLKRYARDVAQAIGETPTTQSQFDAMVSFHYNTGAIARATLTKRHIARDYTGAAGEFKRWNKAGGRVLKGLVRRRTEEEALYRGK
ncbi:MAG: lysozyme [Pseudomonadota bacterium]